VAIVSNLAVAAPSCSAGEALVRSRLPSAHPSKWVVSLSPSSNREGLRNAVCQSVPLIRWPEKYTPGRTAVHVRNELEMPARSDVVWAWLVRAELWPTWYANSANVVIEGAGQDLAPGTRFKWTTFGVRLDSRVEEFVPEERLAWSARSRGIDAYHAWLIERTPSGCHVLTEETQNGWLARLSNSLRPHNASRQHQKWLEGLAAKAKEGLPPTRPP
jgi:hypothetical protein